MIDYQELSIQQSYPKGEQKEVNQHRKNEVEITVPEYSYYEAS